MGSDNGFNDPFLIGNKWSITPPASQLPVMRVFPGYHTRKRNQSGVYQTPEMREWRETKAGRG
jgi:hypothetical protein